MICFLTVLHIIFAADEPPAPTGVASGLFLNYLQDLVHKHVAQNYLQPSSDTPVTYKSVHENVRCTGSKVLTKGKVKTASECQAKCTHNQQCNYYAFWKVRKYCETYDSCKTFAPDGNNLITVYKKLTECEIASETYLPAIVSSFPDDAVRNDPPGKNIACKCITNRMMVCGIFIDPGSRRWDIVEARLDRNQPIEKLIPFLQIPSPTGDRRPQIAYIPPEAAEDWNKSSGKKTPIGAEINVLPLTHCIKLEICTEGTPAMPMWKSEKGWCPFLVEPFRSGDPVYILNSQVSDVIAGTPMPCIAASGMRTWSVLNNAVPFPDPFGRERGRHMLLHEDYTMFFIFDDTDMATGLCSPEPVKEQKSPDVRTKKARKRAAKKEKQAEASQMGSASSAEPDPSALSPGLVHSDSPPSDVPDIPEPSTQSESAPAPADYPSIIPASLRDPRKLIEMVRSAMTPGLPQMKASQGPIIKPSGQELQSTGSTPSDAGPSGVQPGEKPPTSASDLLASVKAAAAGLLSDISDTQASVTPSSPKTAEGGNPIEAGGFTTKEMAKSSKQIEGMSADAFLKMFSNNLRPAKLTGIKKISSRKDRDTSRSSGGSPEKSPQELLKIVAGMSSNSESSESEGDILYSDDDSQESRTIGPTGLSAAELAAVVQSGIPARRGGEAGPSGSARRSEEAGQSGPSGQSVADLLDYIQKEDEKVKMLGPTGLSHDELAQKIEGAHLDIKPKSAPVSPIPSPEVAPPEIPPPEQEPGPSSPKDVHSPASLPQGSGSDLNPSGSASNENPESSGTQDSSSPDKARPPLSLSERLKRKQSRLKKGIPKDFLSTPEGSPEHTPPASDLDTKPKSAPASPIPSPEVVPPEIPPLEQEPGPSSPGANEQEPRSWESVQARRRYRQKRREKKKLEKPQEVEDREITGDVAGPSTQLQEPKRSPPLSGNKDYTSAGSPDIESSSLNDPSLDPEPKLEANEELAPSVQAFFDSVRQSQSQASSPVEQVLPSVSQESQSVQASPIMTDQSSQTRPYNEDDVDFSQGRSGSRQTWRKQTIDAPRGSNNAQVSSKNEKNFKFSTYFFGFFTMLIFFYIFIFHIMNIFQHSHQENIYIEFDSQTFDINRMQT